MKKKEIEAIEELYRWVKGFCREVKRIGAQDFACEALTIGAIYDYVVRVGESKKIMDKVERILARNKILPFQMRGLKISRKPYKTLSKGV